MKKTEIKIIIETNDLGVPTATSVQANAVSTATMLLAVTRLLETLQEHVKKDDNHNLSDVMATLLAYTIANAPTEDLCGRPKNIRSMK